MNTPLTESRVLVVDKHINTLDEVPGTADDVRRADIVLTRDKHGHLQCLKHRWVDKNVVKVIERPALEAQPLVGATG